MPTILAKMRLWSIKFEYLDPAGLVAVWRESLLAKKVLEGKTNGYKNHPQLLRFKNHKYPLKAINTYLYCILKDSIKRGYNFDSAKINSDFLDKEIRINVTKGQLDYELKLLKQKLEKRNYLFYSKLSGIEIAEPNRIFNEVAGLVEQWEKIK